LASAAGALTGGPRVRNEFRRWGHRRHSIQNHCQNRWPHPF